MAYTKVSNKSQDKDVSYLNKDYNSFKNNLINFTKVYFPDNFNDFSEGNPGMMFLEMAAYVGDVLSFYTDTQLKEAMLVTAQEKDNLYNLSYALGYKPKASTAASVNLDVYQLVPSKLIGGEYLPDYSYTLDVNQNSTVGGSGITFYTTKDTRFGFSSSFDPTEVSVYQYDSSNNPEYYLLNKKTTAISGDTRIQTFEIGNAERFKTLELFDTDILSIESITDSEENEWTEVPYLAQDTKFEEIPNLVSFVV